MGHNDDGLFSTTLRDELQAAFAPLEQLQQVQLRRLQTLLNRAVQFVPLYRERYGEHRDWLADISNVEMLWRLPAITKQDLLAAAPFGHVDEREEATQLVRRTTSGSLGPALSLYAARNETIIHSALLWSGWMSRVSSSDRLCCLSAPQLEFQHQFVPNIFIPLTDSGAGEAVKRFQEFKPTVVIGSVESIALLARDLAQRDIAERHGVRAIFPFGQTLTPQLRAMIREGFEAEIFNLYGTLEGMWLGIECEQHDGLHVPLSRVIVQIAKFNEPDVPAAAGELGEVIVTSLSRWTSPIIRYRVGDAAMLETTPCPCGRHTPRIKSLEGRIQDFLVSTSGCWISPVAIHLELMSNGAIDDFRVVQQTPRHVQLSIVPAPGFGEGERRRVTDAIRRLLGQVDLTIELVNEIPREPSGKRRRIHRAFSIDGAANAIASNT
jgi:phenylacetate-CoA ligase